MKPHNPPAANGGRVSPFEMTAAQTKARRRRRMMRATSVKFCKSTWVVLAACYRKSNPWRDKWREKRESGSRQVFEIEKLAAYCNHLAGEERGRQKYNNEF